MMRSLNHVLPCDLTNVTNALLANAPRYANVCQSIRSLSGVYPMEGLHEEIERAEYTCCYGPLVPVTFWFK